MKICAFGTVRMDILTLDRLSLLEHAVEIKVPAMRYQLGGSVYNTVAVLNAMKREAVLYLLSGRDSFSGFIREQIDQRHIPYHINEEDINQTALSFIFLDKKGEKKMLSYDGDRQDTHTLEQLDRDASDFDLFYTSFYEITKSNYKHIVRILENVRIGFVDLTPLLENVPKYVLNAVLERVSILSGTQDEYRTLYKKLGLDNFKAFSARYAVDYNFVKCGKNGAKLIYDGNQYISRPKEVRVSRNTTGCGDTFNAAVIMGLEDGAGPQELLDYAVDLSSFTAYEGFSPEKIAKEFAE